MLLMIGNGGYLGAWIVEQRVTTEDLLARNADLGHRPQILQTADITTRCEEGTSSIELFMDNRLGACIHEWGEEEAESADERRFFLKDHESQFYAGRGGEDLYVDSIHRAHLRLVSKVVVSLHTGRSSLGQLIESAYRLPWAIALDGVRARSGPSVTFSNLTKQWSIGSTSRN